MPWTKHRLRLQCPRWEWRHSEEGDVEGLEIQGEEGEEAPGRDPTSENLLDRLLYKAVLPRYAFPTDVAAFHVFDRERSTRFRHAFRFTPSQGLPAALSQYAPGKEVWIDNKLWTSGAIYSPVQSDRYEAWQRRRLYYECKDCRFASTDPLEAGQLGDTKTAKVAEARERSARPEIGCVLQDLRIRWIKMKGLHRTTSLRAAMPHAPNWRCLPPLTLRVGGKSTIVFVFTIQGPTYL